MAETTPQFDPKFMDRALDLAAAASTQGEVPVGCVIVGPAGDVVAAHANRMVELKDPTAHAELNAIRAACASLGLGRLEGCDLYVTLEPCGMCAAAISFARIRNLYFGYRCRRCHQHRLLLSEVRSKHKECKQQERHVTHGCHVYCRTLSRNFYFWHFLYFKNVQ